MKEIHICPVCGATNSANMMSCQQCSTPFFSPTQAREGLGPLDLPLSSTDEKLHTSSSQRLLMEEPGVKIVRPPSRRKFLVGLLGSGAILAIGSAGWVQAAEYLKMALQSKDYPYHIGDDLVSVSFSPDLNFMAMVKVGQEDSPDAKLYIWDYQQQHMTSLPTGPGMGYPSSVWSPDNRHLLYQGETLDLWDVQTQQKIQSYSGNAYISPVKSYWSPDGSQIALLLGDNDNMVVIMDARNFKPLFSFTMPVSMQTLTWSPDGLRLAFLPFNDDRSQWSVQIWNLLSRTMENQFVFRGQPGLYLGILTWSPDGKYLAVLNHGQIQLIHTTKPATSYALDIPNDSGNLAWSPDSIHLAIVTNKYDSLTIENRFEVWDITERKSVRAFYRSDFSHPEAIAWSKDGSQIIVIGGLYRQESWDW